MVANVLPHGTKRRGVLVGGGIAGLAVILSQFAALPAMLIDPAILDGYDAASRPALSVLLVLNFVLLGSAGVVYMYLTDRGWEWIDLQWPSVRDVLWMVGGSLTVLALYLIVGIVSTVLDVPAADSSIVLFLQDDVTMILIMIGVVWLLNAPAEEFLFRNVIQKRLYENFSGIGAVIVTSIIFLIMHIPMYLTLAETPLSTLLSLSIMFTGSIVYGYLYLRTENLVVPTVVHAAINSLALVQLLIVTIYDIDMAGQLIGPFVGLG